MNMLNPSPETLALIKQVQAKRWAELDVQTSWTERDFAEVLHCHNEYMAEKKDWMCSEATIQKLAFDVRTPDRIANQLQGLAKQMAQFNPKSAKNQHKS